MGDISYPHSLEDFNLYVVFHLNIHHYHSFPGAIIVPNLQIGKLNNPKLVRIIHIHWKRIFKGKREGKKCPVELCHLYKLKVFKTIIKPISENSFFIVKGQFFHPILQIGFKNIFYRQFCKIYAKLFIFSVRFMYFLFMSLNWKKLCYNTL